MSPIPSPQENQKKRQMKETLFTRHRNTVEPITFVDDDRKTTLQALHTNPVNNAVNSQGRIVVLYDRPHPIKNSVNEQPRKELSALALLRSGYCRLEGSYKSIFKKDGSLNVCADCSKTPHAIKHFLACLAQLTTLIPSNLWSRPIDSIRQLS